MVWSRLGSLNQQRVPRNLVCRKQIPIRIVERVTAIGVDCVGKRAGVAVGEITVRDRKRGRIESDGEKIADRGRPVIRACHVGGGGGRIGCNGARVSATGESGKKRNVQIKRGRMFSSRETSRSSEYSIAIGERLRRLIGN